MKICYNNQNISQPAFGEWRKEVYKKTKIPTAYKELLYRTDTAFFRKDMNWNDIAQLIEKMTENAKKVRIYDYACSDGSESFSILMNLISKLSPETLKKIDPIVAKDIDNEAIRRAKSKIADITQDEQNRINFYTDNNFDRFFTPTNIEDCYKVSPELTDKIHFSVADIQKDYKHVKYKNSVIFLRNIWPYLGFDNICKLAKKICKRMDKSTLLVIGNYDTTHKYDSANYLIGDILHSLGLREVIENRVYQKKVN